MGIYNTCKHECKYYYATFNHKMVKTAYTNIIQVQNY